MILTCFHIRRDLMRKADIVWYHGAETPSKSPSENIPPEPENKEQKKKDPETSEMGPERLRSQLWRETLALKEYLDARQYEILAKIAHMPIATADDPSEKVRPLDEKDLQHIADALSSVINPRKEFPEHMAEKTDINAGFVLASLLGLEPRMKTRVLQKFYENLKQHNKKEARNLFLKTVISLKKSTGTVGGQSITVLGDEQEVNQMMASILGEKADTLQSQIAALDSSVDTFRETMMKDLKAKHGIELKPRVDHSFAKFVNPEDDSPYRTIHAFTVKKALATLGAALFGVGTILPFMIKYKDLMKNPLQTISGIAKQPQFIFNAAMTGASIEAMTSKRGMFEGGKLSSAFESGYRRATDELILLEQENEQYLKRKNTLIEMLHQDASKNGNLVDEIVAKINSFTREEQDKIKQGDTSMMKGHVNDPSPLKTFVGERTYQTIKSSFGGKELNLSEQREILKSLIDVSVILVSNHVATSQSFLPIANEYSKYLKEEQERKKAEKELDKQMGNS